MSRPQPRILTVALSLLLAGCALLPPAPPSAPQSSASPTTSPVTSSDGSTMPPFTLASLPRVDGSTANIPLISLMIQRLSGASQVDADNAAQVSTTPDAYRALARGDADLLVVYEADASVKKELADAGVKLESHPIGRDALVFFTNSSNPVTSLTTDEYRAIYDGSVTNWKELGGKDAAIVAYQRPEESGSQALMRKYVMGDAKMAPAPTERITGDMGGIIEGVSSYANSSSALGYSVYYYLANMYAVDGISMLAVADVLPSSETIASGEYPYVNDFYAIVRADEPAGSPARRVLDWLLSPAGRQTVIDAGYVPTKA